MALSDLETIDQNVLEYEFKFRPDYVKLFGDVQQSTVKQIWEPFV